MGVEWTEGPGWKRQQGGEERNMIRYWEGCRNEVPRARKRMETEKNWLCVHQKYYETKLQLFSDALKSRRRHKKVFIPK